MMAKLLMLILLITTKEGRHGDEDGKTERLGGPAVHDHLVFHRKLHRQIARLSPRRMRST
jgi:hypothetical protein